MYLLEEIRGHGRGEGGNEGNGNNELHCAANTRGVSECKKYQQIQIEMVFGHFVVMSEEERFNVFPEYLG